MAKRKGKKRKPRPPEKADPLKVEFSLRGKGKIPNADQARAIFLNWAMGKPIPRRVHISFVRWQNPGRTNPALRNWREARTPGEIRHARETLRLRGWLHGAKIEIAQIRTNRLPGRSTSDLTGLRPGKRKPAPTKKLRSVSRFKDIGTQAKLPFPAQNTPRMARSSKRKRRVKRTGKSGNPSNPKKRLAKNALKSNAGKVPRGRK